MDSKSNTIKIVSFKVGWRRQVVNCRGKKMVYGVWWKPPKLKAKYTLESVRDLASQHGLELEEALTDVYKNSILNT